MSTLKQVIITPPVIAVAFEQFKSVLVVEMSSARNGKNKTPQTKMKIPIITPKKIEPFLFNILYCHPP